MKAKMKITVSVRARRGARFLNHSEGIMQIRRKMGVLAGEEI